MDEAILQVTQLKKIYGSRAALTTALNGLSFSVQKGEFVGIMGASGSGKTTLLNCIATIDHATSGQILVDGQEVTTLHGAALADFRSKKLGFIFQDYNLLDTLTAAENISLALSIAKTPPRDIPARVQAIARALNIEPVLDKFPYELSGGQQQRVAAARAMVTRPALILADEPTGSLDSAASQKLLALLSTLNQTFHATILMVTHDAVSASYCQRILFIRDGQLFNELRRGSDPQNTFFSHILDVVSVMGGDANVRH